MSGFAEYTDYDGLGLAELVRSREVAAGEVLEAAIERIEALNPTLNAVVTKVYDEARAAAAAHDAAAPLAGVPFLLKDLGGAQAGVPLTAGSRFFAHAPAPVDAEIVVRYKRAGPADPRPHQHAGVRPQRDRPSRCCSARPATPGTSPARAGGSSGGSAAAVAAAHGAARPCQRRRRLDPHPGLLLRPVRPQDHAQPQQPRALCRRGPGRLLGRARGLAQRARQRRGARCHARGRPSGDPYFAPPPARPFLEEVGAAPGRLRIALATAGVRRRPGATRTASRAAEAAAHLCEELGHRVEEAAPAFDVAGLDENYNLDLRGQRRGQHPAARRARSAASLDPAGFERVTWAHGRDGRPHAAPPTTSRCSTGCTASAARSQAFFDDLRRPAHADAGRAAGQRSACST